MHQLLRSHWPAAHGCHPPAWRHPVSTRYRAQQWRELRLRATQHRSAKCLRRRTSQVSCSQPLPSTPPC